MPETGGAAAAGGPEESCCGTEKEEEAPGGGGKVLGPLRPSQQFQEGLVLRAPECPAHFWGTRESCSEALSLVTPHAFF